MILGWNISGRESWVRGDGSMVGRLRALCGLCRGGMLQGQASIAVVAEVSRRAIWGTSGPLGDRTPISPTIARVKT
ncbi:hypothetical protein IG631_21267 [Alternaria alternata]|nr:hypothetical protein IG631_21267 [Alternaria alternata]